MSNITEENASVTTGRRARLSPEKQALLTQRLKANKSQQAAQIARRNPGKLAPLSFMQESLWLQNQLEPDGVTYHLPATIRLCGALNVAALEWSVNEIIKRHESLRTNYQLVDGHPVQIIRPTLTLSIPLVDLRSLRQQEQAHQVEQLTKAESTRHFDLERDPLLRMSLLCLDDQEHIVLFTTHHIISDGWSRMVFIKELVAFYENYQNQYSYSMAPLPVQYADFSVWQREQFTQGNLDEQLTYWQQQLSGAPFILDLPTDSPRGALRTFKGSKKLFHIPQEMVADLKQLSQHTGTTLFMTLLAAFQVLLYRYTGQDDFLIGSPIANRQRSELEGLIGFFANTIVLRAQLSASMSFSDLVQQVKQTSLSAYANQEVAFEKLVELVQPTRSAAYSPLFQVMFAHQNQSIEEIHLPSLTLSLLTEDSEAAKFDLALSMNENKNELIGKLEYNSDLFSSEAMDRLITHFQVLLKGIIANPKQDLGQLPLLSSGELQQLLYHAQPQPLVSASLLCIHQLFALQAAKTPEAVALTYGNHSLTYQQLEIQANQVAHTLRALGVKSDVLVGLYAHRSIEMVVGLLAILKAGGAYVPLDPMYPGARLAYMIEDSQLKIILSQPGLASNITNPSVTVLDIANTIAKAGSQHQEPVQADHHCNQLAYAIYTSGSTGKPKGVMVEHRNVTSFMNAMDSHLSSTGTWLALTSISFDISVLELFWTLTRGYHVVIANSQLVSSQATYAHQAQAIDFSLFYFASEDNQTGDKYQLLMDGARFADEHGFSAVWSPERHFAAFGGLYPNPAIASAAIAAITKRIGIRAGSCVLPLNNPIRVAEDWALVDNLSAGRAGLSFASGWQPNDFVLAPDHYAERNKIMVEGIAKVQALLRGEGVTFINGLGQEVEIRTLPRPVQAQLPMWLTASGNPETFRQAGELGLNVLTHLLGQTSEELAEKIKIYRKAWQQHGHGPHEGQVTLMLHTFVGEEEQKVQEQVKQPLKNYLRDSIALLKPFADAMGQDLQQASEQDMDAILEHAFTRYYKTSGLFGTVQSCQLFIDQLKGIGVNEIACLIDFGINKDVVLNSLHHLSQLRLAVQPNPKAHTATNLLEEIPELINKHHITHVQCTPSMASALMNDETTSSALASINSFLVGGEALPLALAQNITASLQASLFNMYGPTEATIWSSLQKINADSKHVLIGKPLANSTIYILDQQHNPVPVGIAGELYIGGAGVVRGYLHQPALTEERFVELAIQPGQTKRLYRTGDRARFISDGSLEHLGRMDHQVKIRGFRVELGEIEKVIAGYPGVQEVVVTLNSETSDLAAYIIWQQSAAEELVALRTYLKRQLPDYMVPAFYLKLDSFPLTPNGKINRNALPAVKEHSQSATQAYVAPSTPLELIIAPIWASAMSKAQVGVHDNFFELGGHSLLAASLATKIQAATGKRLPLHQFFEHPTIAGIALYLQQSSEQVEADMMLPAVIVDVANRYSAFPLTDVQQAYLIGRSGAFELGNISTHGYVELDFTTLNPQQLILAWNQLIARHEMLRMVITEDSQQHILANVPHYDIPLTNVSLWSTEAATQHVQAVREEMSHQVLPAHRWPLFDLRLTQLSEQSYRLHISMDTLIADGWSTDILFRELYEFYSGNSLPALSLSFRDYVIADRKIKHTSLYHKAKEYWLQRINTLPLGPKLAIAKDPSQIERPEFKRRQTILDQNTWQQLKTKAQKANITPSILLLTAYAETIGQWSSNAHFCLNLTLFHRLPLHAEVNQIIGDFTSLTLLEIDLQTAISFTVLTQKVQKQLWSDLEHKYFSAVEVGRELGNRINSQRTASFPVVFTSTLDTDSSPGLPQTANWHQFGKEVYVITQTPQVYLDHQVVEREGSLHLTWDAVDELFPDRMLDDMFEAYVALLKQLAAKDDIWQQNYRQLVPTYQLQQWQLVNQTAAQQPTALLHELFVQSAGAYPDAWAVISPTARISYRELHALATDLAQQLRAEGAKPNQLVAVVMEKGWEQVVAVLAIQMAGSAYLPIDASLPQERIAHLLATGEVQLALIQPDYSQSLSWPQTIKTMSVERKELSLTEVPTLSSQQTLDDLAYVIFTSGSTGNPKGVMIDHRGAVNTVLDINQRHQVTKADKVLSLSSLSFDLSVYDIFGLLAVGGTIVLPQADLIKDPEHWMQWVRQEQISLWNTVPMFLHMLIEHAEHTHLPVPQSLRLAMLSGDYIPVNLPPRSQQLFPAMKLISMGGATEASIWSIDYPIEEINSDWKTIPYGKPLKNQTMHVLQTNLMHSPIGVPGDICIGGIGLAKGYWRDVEKTANSFIINPHTGEKLYKTGDLGRYLPDGNIEFLGRKDFQVKIQGHRVELGEIEAALLQHEAIEQAVVVAPMIDKTHSKRLVAYVVPSAKVLERYSETSRSKELAFKLSQHGIRQLLPHQSISALPQIEKEEPLALTYFANSLSQMQHPCVSQLEGKGLSLLLHCLSQIKTESMLLPKYHYPSAGSLYPVQTYLHFKAGNGYGIQAGFYYYHPAQHALAFICSDEQDSYPPSEEGFRVYLVAYMPAIQPLYPDLAEEFCLIEAGYMSQLLTAQAASLNVGLVAEHLDDSDALTTYLQLSAEYRLLQVLKVSSSLYPKDIKAGAAVNGTLPQPIIIPQVTRHYLQQQSFRRFSSLALSLDDLSFTLNCLNAVQSSVCSGAAMDYLSIYIHIQSQAVTDLDAGVYQYDSASHSLLWCTNEQVIDAAMHTPNNQPIFTQAGFSIFLIVDKQALATNKDSYLILTGALGQVLMDLAPERLVGICPIGSMDSKGLLSALNLSSEHFLLHSFMGGKIDAEQLKQLPQHKAEIKITSMTELLQDYLGKKLPHYMVPSVFMSLPALPQSANGKIDRAALPEVTSPETSNKDFVAPKTELEIQLAEIWLELLAIPQFSVFDNFFELGGNSLLMLQMQRAIKSRLATEVALVDLFSHTCIRELAEFLAGKTKDNTVIKDSASRAQMRLNAARGQSNSKGKQHA